MSESEPPVLHNGVAVARSIPLRGLQRTVAQRMLESRQTTASVTAMAEVDATALLACLERLRARQAALSLTHLLIAATARCLRRHPRLNATLDGDTIHELAEVNLAVALALPSDDLVAVTIRDADRKSADAIAVELRALRERAAIGKLSMADVRGATFTLSNYGMLRSVVWATPIITPGQTGVLGIGRAASTMIPDDSERGWTARPILPIALTYDHRILNGVPAGRFLDDLADSLATEDWMNDSTEGTPS
jgi:pyruvate/2-oxoglutarate dehydrogenase complex dihydrolipoamide acyltransferase (E2) component